MDPLKCISLNCRGLRDRSKRLTLFHFLKQQKSTIIFLQETHSKQADETIWQKEYTKDTKYKILFNHSGDRSAGQAIILNLKNINILKSGIVMSGRIQYCEIENDEKKILFINIYAPNTDTGRVDFFKGLKNFLVHKIIWQSLVIGGDFNVILNPILDKMGGLATKKNSREMITTMQQDLCLVDIWRMQHPNQKEYTWHQTNPNIRCRLDYFLISKYLIHSAKNSKIYSAIKTDHKIISLKINLGLTSRGPGFWKFNSSFLSDKEYLTMITQLITNKWKEHLSIDDLRVRRDLLKFEIQSASMSYSKIKAKARRERESLLLSKIESLDKKNNQ